MTVNSSLPSSNPGNADLNLTNDPCGLSVIQWKHATAILQKTCSIYVIKPAALIFCKERILIYDFTLSIHSWTLELIEKLNCFHRLCLRHSIHLQCMLGSKQYFHCTHLDAQLGLSWIREMASHILFQFMRVMQCLMPYNDWILLEGISPTT